MLSINIEARGGVNPMTSVIAQVETSATPERALHAMPFVVDGPAAAGRSPSSSRAAWLGPAADLIAIAATLVLLNLLQSPVLLAAAAVLPVAWPVALVSCGAYALRHSLVAGPSVGPVLRAGSTLGFVLLSAAALADPGLPPTALLVATVTITTATVVLRLTARLASKRLTAGLRVVLVGTYDQVRQALDELRRDPHQGLDVVCVCLPDDAGHNLFDIPVVVGIEHLALAVETSGADAVIVQPSEHVRPELLRRLGWQLESRGTAFYLASGLLDVTPARTSVSRLAGLHLVQVRPAPRRGPGRAVKELWERASAALLLILLSPALLAIAVLVRSDSPGPAIFRQPRVGRDGHVFTMLKFRTMTTDAETLAAGLLDENDCDGVLFKLRRDPRVTRVGRVLRRYSLDELPQLVNVAAGRMSLVGPRPALPGEVELYAHDPRRRLAVKPGLTGLWQVSGRSDLSWDESVRLDLLYVDNWSLSLDLAIVARTAGAVLRARGAY